MEHDKNVNEKISGYLEKKGKMKVMSSYKKYWFVLEERLLLYYRSKDEYESLYPYKGYINLGPPCSVKPCSSQSGAVFQLETRRSTITLRASDRDEQNRWMKALMSSLKPNLPPPVKLNHFRYSMDEISKVTESKEIEVFKSTENLPTPPQSPNQEIISKIQKMGAKSYTSSNSSINKEYQYQHKTQKRHSMAENTPTLLPQITSEKKSVSTGKLHLKTFDNNVTKSYFTRGRFKSLSMEKLPSIIIENDQYQTVYSKPSVNHKEILITNDIYDTNPLNYSELTFNSSENIYSEPKIDFNENEMRTMYSSIQLDTKNKKKKKEKEKSLKSPKEKLNLIDRVFKLKVKKNKKEDEQEENIYEEIPVPALSPTDKDTIQILHEVQNILAKKKDDLKDKLSNTGSSDKMEINEMYETFDEINTKKRISAPEVPPKTPKQIPLSPYHDVPKNNLPINKMILPPKRRELVSQKSVDEILQDLDKEEIADQSKPQAHGKVRKLVKQFSTNTLPPTLEEVVMRHKRRSEVVPNRYSDELSILLEQLVQVTTAPLLQPGTTNSLITPKLTDDELLRLLPIRKRRLSEPDYDVPRPHTSLINIPKQEDLESPIKATRFFGEVLSFERNGETPWYSSIAPDSLESDLHIKSQRHAPLKVSLSLEEPSYSSHTYQHHQKIKKQHSFDIEPIEGTRSFCDHRGREYVVNNDIYAQPKKKNHMCYKNANENDKVCDFFVDSLEISLESKTQF